MYGIGLKARRQLRHCRRRQHGHIDSERRKMLVQLTPPGRQACDETQLPHLRMMSQRISGILLTYLLPFCHGIVVCAAADAAAGDDELFLALVRAGRCWCCRIRHSYRHSHRSISDFGLIGGGGGGVER